MGANDESRARPIPANHLNTGKGKLFQARAAEILGAHLGVTFREDHALPIGNPSKPHRFDLVSDEEPPRFVGECKNHGWTVSGIVPSAKLAFLNEAVLYLSHLPEGTVRFIAMRMDRHDRRNETLTEYYYRTYRHLLKGVRLFEIDLESGELREHQ